MSTTATAKIALTALAAPVLAGLAIGLASTASADTDTDNVSPPAPTAQDTVTQLKNQGFRVVVNTASTSPLSDCTVISTRQDHRIARANHGDIAAYVDVYCPPAPAK